MTSKVKKKKKRLIDCVSNQNKKYIHSCDLILKSFLFLEKSEFSRTRVVRLNLSIENPLNISRP